MSIRIVLCFMALSLIINNLCHNYHKLTKQIGIKMEYLYFWVVPALVAFMIIYPVVLIALLIGALLGLFRKSGGGDNTGEQQ